MADVVLKDIVKIYPYLEKKEKKSIFGRKKNEEPKKKTNLQITDKGVVAVQQFNLDIKDGEFIVLVGPSGCGKSTTLRMIAGLEDITEGELFIDGQLVNAVEPKDRDIAMVFQSYALYPHMTVFDNMAYPLKIMPQEITYAFEIECINEDLKELEHDKAVLEQKGVDSAKISKVDSKIKELESRKAECEQMIAKGEISYRAKMTKKMIKHKVLKTAEMLNITEYLQRKPKALSGGQRQRVAIGRAVVRNPKALLMDEPLSNLDAKLRNKMRAEIIKLRSKINTTFIYVTHDQIEAMTLGDRIVVMKDGFIQQIGAPQDVFDHPLNKFVSGFIGTPQMNYFDGKLVKTESGYKVVIGTYEVELSKEKAERLGNKMVGDKDVIIGVRPDHMSISKTGIKGVVEVSELMGTSSHLHCKIDGRDVIAIIPSHGIREEYVGRSLHLGFTGNVVHVFDKETEMNLEF